jgi:hypothetical protein
MSKRANSSENEPRAKRSRLPAGFRLARSVPTGSQPSSSSNSSLFVTVSANSRRRGALTGESRLIPSTPQSSEPPSSSITQPPSDPQPAADDHEEHIGTQVEAGEMPPPETEATAKPKRKRYTTNAVRNKFNSSLKCILTWSWFAQDRLTEWLRFREIFLDEALRHDGLGNFFGHTTCSKCGEHDGIFKCKNCGDGSMLKCLDCTLGIHRTLPLHRVEVNTSVTWCELVSWLLYRGGMARFSSRRRSKASVFAINLDILGNPALVLSQAPRTSSSLTSRVHIISQSTTVNATTNPCRIGSNYCARDGFQQRFHAHKRFSLSTASKHSTNSPCKEKQTCTTTTTLSSDYQIMPSCPLLS